MKSTHHAPGRRQFLCAGASMAIGLGLSRFAVAQRPGNDNENGINPPRRVPGISLLRADGGPAALASLLEGRATALHFMFASCRTICPIQGAVFQRVQQLLPDAAARHLQLLSISVDPEHDSPAVLQGWLQRFHAQQGWTAATTDAVQLATLRQFFGDASEQATHATQVYVINRRGEWVWRTNNMPSAENVASTLSKMAV